MTNDLSENLVSLIDPSEMCVECREGYPTQSYTPRPEGVKLPDPNDGALCRRCATRVRAPATEADPSADAFRSM